MAVSSLENHVRVCVCVCIQLAPQLLKLMKVLVHTKYRKLAHFSYQFCIRQVSVISSHFGNEIVLKDKGVTLSLEGIFPSKNQMHRNPIISAEVEFDINWPFPEPVPEEA